MLIGIPAESMAGETRVAVTPETAKKLKAQGHTVRIQSGAGVAASAPDEAYAAVGAEICDAAGALGCDLVLKVRNLADGEAALVKPGATVAPKRSASARSEGNLWPARNSLCPPHSWILAASRRLA